MLFTCSVYKPFWRKEDLGSHLPSVEPGRRPTEAKVPVTKVTEISLGRALIIRGETVPDPPTYPRRLRRGYFDDLRVEAFCQAFPISSGKPQSELTGYETCNECKGLIVDVGSTTHSSHDSHSSPSPHALASPTFEPRILQGESEEPQQPIHDQTIQNNILATTTGVANCQNCQKPAKGCVIPYKGEPHNSVSNTRMIWECRGLRDFYPGFIQPAPGPCSACRRTIGPHPTKCPGCNHKYMMQIAENPQRPHGYIGKRPPFGQAGWRVARGHRKPKPVTLNSYGCYMQRKPSCYRGADKENFTHLGHPPSMLVNFKSCPRM